MNKPKSHSKEAIKIIDLILQVYTVSGVFNNFTTKFTTVTKPKIKSKNTVYLHGGINLCGTISGRPSGGGGESSVNLLNLPSTGSPLAKQVKQCFRPPEGRLWIGADYTGQEAMAAALVTKDPNMLKPLTKGYDGHSMRALQFFPEKLPKHVKRITKAAKANIADEFFYDDTKTGLDRWVHAEN